MNPTPAVDNSAPAERPGAPRDKKFSEHLKTWICKLADDQRTLRHAFDSLMSVGNSQDEVPLIVRLAENPEYHFSGLGFFKGRVTLEQHDDIHIILGRGLTLMDEAFVLGFTMGSTDRVTTHEANLSTKALASDPGLAEKVARAYFNALNYYLDHAEEFREEGRSAEWQPVQHREQQTAAHALRDAGRIARQ